MPLLAVHPRVCGEHLSGLLGGAAKAGSSPRVRGTPRSADRSSWCSRFIPACAGNTEAIGAAVNVHVVHPRVCGEHRQWPRDGYAAAGSSPRVRGTPLCKRVIESIRRFIPACAGNTHGRPSVPSTRTVHPRVCGEHLSRTIATLQDDGSSPRVRGTLHHIIGAVEHQRFIPACAGNTPKCWSTTTCPPVHPRVCGEHARAQQFGNRAVGSSPRVRGTLVFQWPVVVGARFIPACAGNTANPDIKTTVYTVHPRVCGEHRSVCGFWKTDYGSSPRVRGTHLAQIAEPYSDLRCG